MSAALQRGGQAQDSHGGNLLRDARYDVRDDELTKAQGVVREVLTEGLCRECGPGGHLPGCAHQRVLQWLETLVAEVRQRGRQAQPAPVAAPVQEADYRCARPRCTAMALAGGSFCAYHMRARY